MIALLRFSLWVLVQAVAGGLGDCLCFARLVVVVLFLFVSCSLFDDLVVVWYVGEWVWTFVGCFGGGFLRFVLGVFGSWRCSA